MAPQCTTLRKPPAIHHSVVDLPIVYLEASPFPAFVLATQLPHPQSTPPAASTSTCSEPIWANSQWWKTCSKRPLAECLSPDALNVLTSWVSEQAASSLRTVTVPSMEELIATEEAIETDTESISNVVDPMAKLGRLVIPLTFAFPGSVTPCSLICTILPAPPDLQHAIAVVTAIPQAEIRLSASYRPRLNSAHDSRNHTPSSHTLYKTSSRDSNKASVTIPKAEENDTAEENDMAVQGAAPLDSPTRSILDGTSTTSQTSSLSTPSSGLWAVPRLTQSESVAAVTEHPGYIPCGNYLPGDPIFINSDGTVKAIASAARGVPLTGDSVAYLLQNFDWASTPLGAFKDWPVSLRSIVSMMSLFPMGTAIWWGKELTFLYNQTYAGTLPNHPTLYGVSGDMSMAHLRSSIGRLADALLAGSSIYKDDEYYPKWDTEGRLTEGYRSLLWAPIKNEAGSYGGIWHAARETTQKVIAERRLTLLRELQERTSTCRTIQHFETGVLETLHVHPKDAPFAVMYYVDETERQDCLRLRFAGAVGVPDSHDTTPEVVWLSDMSPPDGEPHDSPPASTISTLCGPSVSDPGWGFAQVLKSRQSAIVECSHLIGDYTPRAWNELPSHALVIPLVLYSDETLPGAVLILGLSPRLVFDDSYQEFTEDMRFQMSSYLTSVKSYATDQRKLGDLATLDKEKSLLFANVSHELITPISLIAGPLDDIIAETDGARRQHLTIARRNVTKLSRLVTMLMEISNLEAGRLKGSFAPTNLGVLTRNVASQFSKSAAKAGLEYTISCDREARDTYIDTEQWEKIMFILIGNALKYTAKGYVRISLVYTHKHAIVTVADSGMGIPNANLKELNMGPNDHGEPAPGNTAGISLTFAKKLVQLHHGDFEAESTTSWENSSGEHGTVFRVRLPMGTKHLPPDALATSYTPAETLNRGFNQELLEEVNMWHAPDGSDDSSGSVSSHDTFTSKLSRGLDPTTLYFTPDDVIMIVDDTPDARRYLRTLFERFCKVVEACSGQEALRMSEERLPDLIVADMMLPGLNGTQLLRVLRNGTREQQLIPVILMTTADQRGASTLQADDYISKPFNARELVARAHMHLQLGKRRRALEVLFDERTMELRLLTEREFHANQVLMPDSPAGIVRADATGFVTYTNLAWVEMSGVPPHAEWPPYLSDECREESVAKWFEFVNSDEPILNFESQWTNGRWISTKLVRLDGSLPGSMGGFIGSGIDITDTKLNEALQRKQIDEALKRRAEAEDARAQQELLIDITSNLHALQEHLQKSMADVTPFQPTEQLLLSIGEDLEALDSIYQCGLAQERISNDVLSLGKMQLDRLEMFDVETDVRKVGQKVLSIFQNEARMNRIALTLSISPAFNLLGLGTVMTDPARLTQVVTNLVSNAIRFTANSQERRIKVGMDVGLEPPYGHSCVKPPIRPRAPVNDATPVYVYVSVSDTGPGLTKSELDNLFQRFMQASPMTHTVFGGSGLGLFVCRKLTERMGGRIEVVSEYGKGSQFRFFIVTRRSPVGRESANAVAPRASLPPLMSLCKPRVLVVEDNVINRTVLLRQLKHVGMVVDSAVNGLEAVRKVQTAMAPDGQSYDCVLMDLEMPVMDGYTAARRLRVAEAAGLPPSVIIALTGNARQVKIEEGMADFDASVIKPYRLDDLLRTMEELILYSPRKARMSPASD